MKKRRKQIQSFFLIALLLGASAFLLRPVVEELIRTIELRQQLQEVELLLTQLEEENTTLEDQRLKLLDPDYVKSYARANYMLSKEGEQIYYLPKSDDDE